MEVGGAFRSSPEGEALRDRVEAGLVAELGSRSLTAGVALLCLLPFFPEVLGGAEKQSPPLRGALWLLWSVVSLRLLATIALRLAPRTSLRTGTRKSILIAGSTLVASGFAVLNLAAIPRLDDTHRLLLAVCHTGISSAAVITMAGSLGGFVIYLVLNLGSFFLAVAVDDSSPIRSLLLGLVVLFFASLLTLSIRVNREARRNLLLSIQLGEAALRDSLTGLRNRRSLADTMAVLSARAAATWSGAPGSKRSAARESLSILMVDIDHFKSVNDRYSHAAGDAVLVQLAERIRDQVRSEDLAVRWGGEEFVVVARSGREGEQPIAERIRKRVCSSPFRLPNGELVPVTCSVGHCLFPFSTEEPTGLTWEEVLGVADLALRTAKKRGRNCSVGIHCAVGGLSAPGTAAGLSDGNLDRAEEEGLVRIDLLRDPGWAPA